MCWFDNRCQPLRSTGCKTFFSLISRNNFEAIHNFIRNFSHSDVHATTLVILDKQQQHNFEYVSTHIFCAPKVQALKAVTNLLRKGFFLRQGFLYAEHKMCLMVCKLD